MRRKGSTRRRFNKVRFKRKVLISLILAVLLIVCFRSCAERNANAEASEPFVAEAVVETTPEPTAVLVPVASYPVPLDDDFQLFVIRLCEEHHIDPAIVFAMIDRESDFNADCIGDNGASFGLLQIQTQHHKDRMDKLGVTDLFDPYQNVTVGVDYLAELIDYYDGNVEMALMAYNAGQTGAYNYWFSAGVYSNDYSREVMETSEILTEGVRMIMYRTDDPIADFNRWDADQARQEAKLPVCADCDHAVQDDHYYEINGEVICPECMESNYRKEVDDLEW